MLDWIQDIMPKIKIDPDIKRFTRYQSVINMVSTTGAELACCKGRSYESALELLARIKAEREASKKSESGQRYRADKKIH